MRECTLEGWHRIARAAEGPCDGVSIFSTRTNANNLCAVHRLNLFPLMHLNFFHMIFNLVAIAPLLERFESEFGTLVTLALFTGPFGTLPGGIYTLLEKFVFRANTVVMGARYA